MYLLRPRPLPSESLSSWRQRAALANGYRIFPVAPTESRRTDPDLAPRPEVIRWLANMHSVPETQLLGMTLYGLNGSLLRFGAGRPAPRWVLPLKYSRHVRSTGIPFCPACLREDETPYFRLKWRLAFAGTCERHGQFLLDSCPKCQTPIWPGPCTQIALYRGKYVELHQCPSCLIDLRHISTDISATVPVHSIDQILAGTVSLAPRRTVPSNEYLLALWLACQLFIRSRSQARILSHRGEARELVEDLQPLQAKSPEHLPLQPRHRLVTTATRLFNSWPDAFIDFCKAHDISGEHFSSDRHEMPCWMAEVVSARLSRQIRGLTLHDVDRAKQSLLDRGYRVTKAAVAKELGGLHSSLLTEVLGRRFMASEAETSAFLEQLMEHTHLPHRRISSVLVRVRNAVILLHASLSQKPVAQVTREAWPVLLAQSDRYAALGSLSFMQRQAVGCLLELNTNFETSSGQSMLRASREETPLLISGFRGGAVPRVGVQRTLSITMAGLDARLARNTSVFHSVLALPVDLSISGGSASFMRSPA